MAKNKKSKSKNPPKTAPKIVKPTWLEKHPIWFAIGLLTILLLVFYHQIFFQGLTFQGGDSLTVTANYSFIKDSFENGTYPMWCPFIYGGMPSYGSLIYVPFVNIIDTPINYTVKFLHDFLGFPSFLRIFLNYILFGMLTFLLLRSKKISYEASLFAAVAIIFLPQYVAFTAYGHNSKFLAVVLIPLILMLVDRLFKKASLLNFALLSLAIGFQLMRSHVQVTYYTFIMIGVYFLYNLSVDIKEKSPVKEMVTKFGFLAASLFTGIILTAVLYLPVYEYQQLSIRGGGTTGGLDFDYATSWSFHPLEMVTFVVPGFMGFGGQTYWGKMPFTDYPLYIGIIVLLLAGIAFLLKRDRFTWFLGTISIFSLIVSFGKHVPILYGPMYKFLPLFDKFRIPSMIHIILDVAVVVLAAIGLNELVQLAQSKMDDKIAKKLKRYLYIFLGIVAATFFYILLAKGSFLNMVANARGGMSPDIMTKAYDMANTDAFKAIILVAIGVILIISFVQQKLSKSWFIVGILSLLLVDLWTVGFKVMNPVPPSNEKAYFAATPAVQEMKKDTSLYRIYPVYEAHSRHSSWYMYHLIQSITGYHAAKLRVYDEFLTETNLLDAANVKLVGSLDQWRKVGLTQIPQLPTFLAKYWSLALENNRAGWVPLTNDDPLVNYQSNMLDMLNVKYLTSQHDIPDPRYRLVLKGNAQRREPSLYENTTVLPRAFFVESVVVASGKENVFAEMKKPDFDVRKTAVVENELPFELKSGNNTVNITDWQNQKIELEANVESPSLMVLSEIYFPAGWKAYVDGKEAPIYKTNYILRSLALEPGQHKIEFVYSSNTFKTGLAVSLISLFALLGIIGLSVWRNRKEA